MEDCSSCSIINCRLVSKSVEAKAFVVEESITNNIIPKPMSYKAGVGKFVLNRKLTFMLKVATMRKLKNF